MKLSIQAKLLGGFVITLVLMGSTLAIDVVASGNQASIGDQIVSHLDPARIAAARIVTLVRSIDDDGAWVVGWGIASAVAALLIYRRFVGSQFA